MKASFQKNFRYSYQNEIFTRFHYVFLTFGDNFLPKRLPMNKIITSICIVFLSTSLVAQTSNHTVDNLLFNNYHLSFQVGYLQNQIHQKGVISKGNLQLFASHGGYVGGSLVINPFTNLGLEVGTNLSLQNFRYEINLKATEFGLANDFNRSQSIPEIYLEVPLAIVPRVAVNDKTWVFARLGMTMSWYAPLDVDFNLSSNPNPTQGENLGLIEMTFYGANPYFAGFAGLGFQHLNKNKDLIGFSLNANLGFSKVLEGTYTIWDNEVSVGSGTFYSNGSYLALQFTYTFTGVKKIEKKIMNYKL